MFTSGLKKELGGGGGGGAEGEKGQTKKAQKTTNE